MVDMTKGKITLKDIAKECGCSVATVSYVLNNVETQTISEERRNKILQIANLYQYSANPFAKALASGNTHTVLIYYEDEEFSLYKAEILNFINKLAFYLNKEGYLLNIVPSKDIMRYDYADAAIVYRSYKDKFIKIANKNFIPLIAIDINIDEPLFFEIHNDLNALLKPYKDKANYEIISLPYKDESINKSLRSISNLTLIDSFKTLNEFIAKNKDQNKEVIALNEELYRFVSPLLETKLINLLSEDKFKAIINSLSLALAKEDVSNHKIIVDSGN